MVKMMVWVRKLTLPLTLAMLLPFVGCSSEEDDAYKKAYDANHAAGYQTGLKEGEERGAKEGAEAGTVAAREAAETGRAWELYWALALGALGFGCMLGLAIQYTVLLVCRRTGRLPQFSAVAFVPAMKSTVVYSIFERRRDVMIEIDEQLREMAARKNLQIARISELKEVMARKIKALTSLDELTQSRLIELAVAELDKIVSNSTKKAEGIWNDPKGEQPATRITHACPYCQQLVRFNLRSANEIVVCPNQECGRSIKLPPVFAGGDGAPLIFDVND